MAEPLSIASGVLALVTGVFKLSQLTKDSVSGIRDGSKAIRLLSGGMKALHEALRSLDELVRDQGPPNVNVEAGGGQFVPASLDHCERVLDGVRSELKPFVKEDGGASASRWRAFVWKYRGNDIATLKHNIFSSAGMVDTTILVVNL